MADFNEKILDKIPGDLHQFFATDSADINEGDNQREKIPGEFLNSINSSGLPSSILKLKIRTPIILLRNLYSQQGLCNGTRLTVSRMWRHSLEARILRDDQDGELQILPRIKLTKSERELPFILSRK